jgi:hypothetical protein
MSNLNIGYKKIQYVFMLLIIYILIQYVKKITGIKYDIN